jgi:hypothetical protein
LKRRCFGLLKGQNDEDEQLNIHNCRERKNLIKEKTIPIASTPNTVSPPSMGSLADWYNRWTHQFLVFTGENPDSNEKMLEIR